MLVAQALLLAVDADVDGEEDLLIAEDVPVTTRKKGGRFLYTKVQMAILWTTKDLPLDA